ncbi:hypothetical protein BP5796_03797 [Coleophoma crateriformis]|uniref:Uncharacterized protein n=1 Tax=Coleophoma crateriformis TaxID=565419 RepID=A0A3D8SGS7_9HELO|nr:hypothetical protein BP5796_03797 [Coleophoma crateriformis]
MAESMGTPGSTADTSVNGGKVSAAKDRACPFCHQQFTSSSLGRHLDLYIKEKNPKPADGIHNVDEIKKMRGGITRRQPRNSMSKREGSTPGGTPAGRPSPGNSDVDMSGHGSPSMRRDGTEESLFPGKPRYIINGPTWESTGVMNHIPSASRNGTSARSWDGDESRRLEGRSRSVSKQMLAKTTFEQKQKMMDALDNAKAAELALRELLGSIRAAKLRKVDASTIFDYDPFTLDFPALTLHCLSPPPTLHSSTPIATSSSWSITPPTEQQYEALRSHFASEFRNWHISCAMATTATQDDLSYPPPNYFVDPVEPQQVAERAEAEAQELEAKLSEHLRIMFTHWSKFPPAKRAELWTLELARGIGRKSDEIQKLKKEADLKEQRNTHLQQQVEDLSRLQQPREFRISPPSTYGFDRKAMAEMGESGFKWSGVGFSIANRNMPLDSVIERAIGKWKEVVREARGGGVAAQRLLSGDSTQSVTQAQQQQVQQVQPQQPVNNVMANGTSGGSADSLGSDADADADADMDEDTSFVDMSEVQHRAPEANMSQEQQQQNNYQLTNGDLQHQQQDRQEDLRIHISGMKGTEKQTCVAGYLRVG